MGNINKILGLINGTSMKNKLLHSDQQQNSSTKKINYGDLYGNFKKKLTLNSITPNQFGNHDITSILKIEMEKISNMSTKLMTKKIDTDLVEHNFKSLQPQVNDLIGQSVVAHLSPLSPEANSAKKIQTWWRHIYRAKKLHRSKELFGISSNYTLKNKFHYRQLPTERL